jgi:hypothetical protein
MRYVPLWLRGSRGHNALSGPYRFPFPLPNCCAYVVNSIDLIDPIDRIALVGSVNAPLSLPTVFPLIS